MNGNNRLLPGRLAGILVVLIASAVLAGASPTTAKAPAPLTEQQKQKIRKLSAEFQAAKTSVERYSALKRIVEMGPEAARTASASVDEKLAVCEMQYFDLLAKRVRAAYIQRLEMLADYHIRKIQYMRRLWKDYLEHTSDQHEFQKNFLKPVWDVAAFLIVRPDQMTDPDILRQRQLLFELARYQAACRKAAGISLDPTVGRKSPTGIDIPHLDQPQTVADYVSLLDRTMALAGSFAPEGGKKILYADIEVSKLIDVQESEFILYCNTVRLLVGSVAWEGDELVCAATRDQSVDRKAGRAHAHSNSMPGKAGFTDRLRRMGAFRCGSEGAGGGRNGPGYAYQLSYGGGHTHPLYSIKRNIIGVGRCDHVYTSDYGTKRNLLYPCPVTEHELFMPPGLTRSDLENADLLAIYKLLQDEKFADAYAKIKTTKVTDKLDKVILRFFSAWVSAELDWFYESANAIGTAGDIYEVKLRLDDARRKFGGIPAFDKKAAILDKLLSGKKMAAELEAGKAYRPIARGIIKAIRKKQLDVKAARKQLDDFAKQYPNTVYAAAATYQPPPDKTGHNDTGVNPIAYFLNKNPDLPKYAYYTYGLEVSDVWPPR